MADCEAAAQSKEPSHVGSFVKRSDYTAVTSKPYKLFKQHLTCIMITIILLPATQVL